jgi:hypothetical protein
VAAKPLEILAAPAHADSLAFPQPPLADRLQANRIQQQHLDGAVLQHQSQEVLDTLRT